MLHTVNVYNIKISNLLPSVHSLYRLLSNKEQIQSKRFFTSNLSNRYIVTRAILRSILSTYIGTTYKDIEFVRNIYGKPYVKGIGIEFNMSHSYDSAYYAITSNFAVGIDVEFYNQQKNIVNIAKSVFSIRELDYFFNLSQCKRQEFFFNTWTKKEAVIKAMGLGLAYPMENVDTIIYKDLGYIKLSKDIYYLHDLTSESRYQVHLVVKNVNDIVIHQHHNYSHFDTK